MGLRQGSMFLKPFAGLSCRYGAPVSLIEAVGGILILTLYLAAKHNQSDAMKCLLELGGCLDNIPGIRGPFHKLLLHE